MAGKGARSDALSVLHGILIQMGTNSWPPGIRRFDSEATLIELGWIGSYQTGEALSGGVDHKQVAIRTVVPAEANIGAGCLIIRGVHLQQG